MARQRDEVSTSFSLELRRERQEVTRSEVEGWIPLSGSTISKGFGRLLLTYSDNVNGIREAYILTRPVNLGRVEMTVSIESQAVGALRRHRKLAWMTATPKAARDFAALLIDAAEEAEEIARLNGPQQI
jgi:hypothetical protein